MEILNDIDFTKVASNLDGGTYKFKGASTRHIRLSVSSEPAEIVDEEVKIFHDLIYRARCASFRAFIDTVKTGPVLVYTPLLADVHFNPVYADITYARNSVDCARLIHDQKRFSGIFVDFCPYFLVYHNEAFVSLLADGAPLICPFLDYDSLYRACLAGQYSRGGDLKRPMERNFAVSNSGSMIEHFPVLDWRIGEKSFVSVLFDALTLENRANNSGLDFRWFAGKVASVIFRTYSERKINAGASAFISILAFWKRGSEISLFPKLNPNKLRNMKTRVDWSFNALALGSYALMVTPAFSNRFICKVNNRRLYYPSGKSVPIDMPGEWTLYFEEDYPDEELVLVDVHDSTPGSIPIPFLFRMFMIRQFVFLLQAMDDPEYTYFTPEYYVPSTPDQLLQFLQENYVTRCNIIMIPFVHSMVFGSDSGSLRITQYSRNVAVSIKHVVGDMSASEELSDWFARYTDMLDGVAYDAVSTERLTCVTVDVKSHPAYAFESSAVSDSINQRLRDRENNQVKTICMGTTPGWDDNVSMTDNTNVCVGEGLLNVFGDKLVQAWDPEPVANCFAPPILLSIQYNDIVVGPNYNDIIIDEVLSDRDYRSYGQSYEDHRSYNQDSEEIANWDSDQEELINSMFSE